MSEPVFDKYRRTQIAEMTPWVPGSDMSRVSVSASDREAGSPKTGDMIARNPKNHDDQWLVAAQYFADNFAALEAPDEAIATARRERDEEIAKGLKSRAIAYRVGFGDQSRLNDCAVALEKAADDIRSGAIKAAEDALTGGTGFMKDGKRIDPSEVYQKAPDPSPYMEGAQGLVASAIDERWPVWSVKWTEAIADFAASVAEPLREEVELQKSRVEWWRIQMEEQAADAKARAEAAEARCKTLEKMELKALRERDAAEAEMRRLREALESARAFIAGTDDGDRWDVLSSIDAALKGDKDATD